MLGPWGVPRCNNCGVRHINPPDRLQAAYNNTQVLTLSTFGFFQSFKETLCVHCFKDFSHAFGTSRSLVGSAFVNVF